MLNSNEGTKTKLNIIKIRLQFVKSIEKKIRKEFVAKN